MTDENTTTYDIREELNTIMAGDAPLQNLRAIQTGPVHYTVLSARNGSPTVHRVDLQDATCSCEDMTYNNNLQSDSDEGREICAHLAFAMLEHPQLDASESVVYEHLGMMDAANSLMRDLQDERDAVEEALVGLRDAQAGGTSTTTSDTTESAESGDETPSPPGEAVNAADAADRLQEAFDAAVDDMQVQHHEGWVWVQTGRDTPDALDAPGNPDPFTIFLQEPDQIEYIHDEHDAVGQKPGEWWKNRIAPEAVDEYISEVLS